MYKIGDKIVYPMHGAGEIVSIKDESIFGQTQSYYIVKIPIGDMKIMIPTNNVEDIGIREVIDTNEADKVFAVFEENSNADAGNWNKRYRENMFKMKSGNIFELADVVRTLMMRDHKKGLSTGERKMLNIAKQVLISELVLAKGINQDKIEDTLKKLMKIE